MGVAEAPPVWEKALHSVYCAFLSFNLSVCVCVLCIREERRLYMLTDPFYIVFCKRILFPFSCLLPEVPNVWYRNVSAVVDRKYLSLNLPFTFTNVKTFSWSSQTFIFIMLFVLSAVLLVSYVDVVL